MGATLLKKYKASLKEKGKGQKKIFSQYSSTEVTDEALMTGGGIML